VGQETRRTGDLTRLDPSRQAIDADEIAAGRRLIRRFKPRRSGTWRPRPSITAVGWTKTHNLASIIEPGLRSRPLYSQEHFMTLRAVELFAGAGGLAMGVSLAGFKSLAVVEWDK
jgi:hypothetical protein